MRAVATWIGLAGCAILGPTFLVIGLRDMWARRGSAERMAELDAIEAAVQRWLARRRG